MGGRHGDSCTGSCFAPHFVYLGFQHIELNVCGGVVDGAINVFEGFLVISLLVKMLGQEKESPQFDRWWFGGSIWQHTQRVALDMEHTGLPSAYTQRVALDMEHTGLPSAYQNLP